MSFVTTVSKSNFPSRFHSRREELEMSFVTTVSKFNFPFRVHGRRKKLDMSFVPIVSKYGVVLWLEHYIASFFDEDSLKI